MVFFVIMKKNVHVKYKFIKQDMQSEENDLKIHKREKLTNK